MTAVIARRTLDAAEELLATMFDEGYPSHLRAEVVRALESHAANECAKLRQAGEALAKAMADIASFDCATAGVASPCSRAWPECESCIARAALVAWQEAAK